LPTRGCRTYPTAPQVNPIKYAVESAHVFVKLLQRRKKDVFLEVLVLGAELEEASFVVDIVFDMRRSKAMGGMMGWSCRESM
jgi:hypothetical protein